MVTFFIGQFEYYYAWINFWLHTHNRFSLTKSLTFCPLPIRYKNTEKNRFMSVMSLWWPMMINCRIDEFWGVFIYSDQTGRNFGIRFFVLVHAFFLTFNFILHLATYVWFVACAALCISMGFLFLVHFFLIFKFENEGEKINWMRRLLWIFFFLLKYFSKIDWGFYVVWVQWYAGILVFKVKCDFMQEIKMLLRTVGLEELIIGLFYVLVVVETSYLMANQSYPTQEMGMMESISAYLKTPQQ